MKKKVLICGATGFIGRNLTEQLSKREDLEIHAVRFQHSAFDCGNNIIWHQADLRHQDDVDRVVKNMDIIIQTAATTANAKEAAAKPYLQVTDNAIMNSYLFRSACEHKINHVIFFSCASVYHSSDSLLKETDFNANQPLPAQQFGNHHTKLYLEKMCEFYAGIAGTKYTTIRHAHIYGPHDKFDLERSHLFGSMVTKIMTGKDKMTLTGTCEEANDYLYIDDLMYFIEAAIAKQTSQYRLYNAGSGIATTTAELTRKILQHAGKNLIIEPDLSHLTNKSCVALDCTLAKNELGWTPQVDLDSGIRKTLSWWRENVRIKVAEPA